MVSKDDVQKYLDAGIAFTTVTRAKAEELVEELVGSGSGPRGEAWAKVDHLIERGRKGSELVVAQVTHQLSALGITSVEDLAREVSTLISRTAEAGRTATQKAGHAKAAGGAAGGRAADDTADEQQAGAGESSAGEDPAPTSAGKKRPAATSAKQAGSAKQASSAKAATAKTTTTKPSGTKQSTKKSASSTKQSAPADPADPSDSPEPGASD